MSKRLLLSKSSNVTCLIFVLSFFILLGSLAFIFFRLSEMLKEESVDIESVSIEETIQSVLYKTNQEIFLLKVQLIDDKFLSISELQADILTLEKIIEDLVIKSKECEKLLHLQKVEGKVSELKQSVLEAQQSLAKLNSLTHQ